MSVDSTNYPPEQQTKLIQPGELKLDRVAWKPVGALVEGSVGRVPFVLNVETADLLNRRRFAFCLWRYCHLLAAQPDITDWRQQIADAEQRGSA